MQSHLVRRGSIWWARLVVPQRLRAAAGRREFIQLVWRHMSIDVLRLVDGSPILTSEGWVPLSTASDMSGISQKQLPRLAASGGLGLWCRVPRLAGYLVPTCDLAGAQSTEQGLARPNRELRSRSERFRQMCLFHSSKKSARRCQHLQFCGMMAKALLPAWSDGCAITAAVSSLLGTSR